MPFYTWREKKSGKVIEVFRNSLSEYKLPPSEEDLKELKIELEVDDPEWERIVAGIKIIRPYSFTFRGNE